MLALPRFIRYSDAPGYLGMDKNRFNAEVRPLLVEIPICVRQGREPVLVVAVYMTFGIRLVNAFVQREFRLKMTGLLGHKSSQITTHYSKAEVSGLLAAVELLCDSVSNIKIRGVM